MLYGGDLYIADQGDNRVRKVHAGVISTVAGDGDTVGGGANGDGGDATAAHVDCPGGIAFDSDGDLFIAEGCGERKLRRVDHLTGHISTVASVGEDGITGDLGGAIGTRFGDVVGLVFDADDNLYVTAPTYGSTRIRKIVRPL